MARLGGDEFVMLLRGAAEPWELRRRFVSLLEALDGSSVIAGVRIRTPASLGFARFPEDRRSGDQLCAAAEAALYEGKRSGKGRSARVTGVMPFV